MRQAAVCRGERRLFLSLFGCVIAFFFCVNWKVFVSSLHLDVNEFTSCVARFILDYVHLLATISQT